jgi:hypothetical protein
MEDRIHNEPSFVEAEDGVVSVEGPNGVSVLMTPEAAEETSHRLLDGAAVARGQAIIGKGAKPKPDKQKDA